MLATGEGSLGSCRSYFDSTLGSLEAMGVRDAGLERIRHALKTRLRLADNGHGSSE